MWHCELINMELSVHNIFALQDQPRSSAIFVCQEHSTYWKGKFGGWKIIILNPLYAFVINGRVDFKPVLFIIYEKIFNLYLVESCRKVFPANQRMLQPIQWCHLHGFGMVCPVHILLAIKCMVKPKLWSLTQQK